MRAPSRSGVPSPSTSTPARSARTSAKCCAVAAAVGPAWLCSRFGRVARRGSHSSITLSPFWSRPRPGAANVIVVPSVRRTVIVVRGPQPRPSALIVIVARPCSAAIAAMRAPLFLVPNEPWA